MTCNLRPKYFYMLVAILLIITSLPLAGCGGAKTYTIGVIHENPMFTVVWDSFKSGMAEAGYVEGKNVTYIYHGVLNYDDPQVIDNEIKNLMAQKIDMILAIGKTCMSVKPAVEGTKMPVVFAPGINVVELGLVKSLRQPGGNLTGVQGCTTVPESVGWLLKIAPGTKKVYVPSISNDLPSTLTIGSLKAAPNPGAEVVFEEFDSSEKIAAAVKTLPKDTALFLVPMSQDVTAVIKAATEQRIPVGAYQPEYVRAGALVSYAGDLGAMGKQAARMADQVLRGVSPANLPVENGENFLTINLKAADAIGLNIPDEILRQADTVIR